METLLIVLCILPFGQSFTHFYISGSEIGRNGRESTEGESKVEIINILPPKPVSTEVATHIVESPIFFIGSNSPALPEETTELPAEDQTSLIKPELLETELSVIGSGHTVVEDDGIVLVAALNPGPEADLPHQGNKEVTDSQTTKPHIGIDPNAQFSDTKTGLETKIPKADSGLIIKTSQDTQIWKRPLKRRPDFLRPQKMRNNFSQRYYGAFHAGSYGWMPNSWSTGGRSSGGGGGGGGARGGGGGGGGGR